MSEVSEMIDQTTGTIFIIGLAVLVAFLLTKLVKPLPAPQSIEGENLRAYMYKRIEISREAITALRKDTRFWPQPGTRDMFPVTYGFYGLLDYIELGDPEKILDPTMRRFVQTAIRDKAQGDLGP